METHTKGASVRSFLRWYERTHDRERLLRAASKVPGEHRHLIDPDREALGVLPSLWYPSALVWTLVDELTAGLSEAELDHLARGGAEVIIQEGLKGVYKMLFILLITPARYAKNSNRIWRMFHDTGTTETEVIGPTEHLTRIAGWRGHHPFLCRLHRASMAVTYQVMKCRRLVLTDEGCVTRGSAACVSRLAWD